MIGDHVSYDWTVELLADYGEETQHVLAEVLTTIILSYEDQDTFNLKMIEQECWDYVHKNVPFFTLDDGNPTWDYDFVGRYEILRSSVLDLVRWVLDEYRDVVASLQSNLNIKDVYCLNYHKSVISFRIVGC